jgi:hypothetical protein
MTRFALRILSGGSKVRKPGVRPVVLIVHEDLGFVCWLGKLLGQAGCQAVPALSSRDAVRLVADLNLPIDLAIIDPGLQGVTKAIKRLSDQHPSLRTLAIRTPCRDPIGSIDSLARPSGLARVPREERLRCVRRILKKARVAA